MITKTQQLGKTDGLAVASRRSLTQTKQEVKQPENKSKTGKVGKHRKIKEQKARDKTELKNRVLISKI